MTIEPSTAPGDAEPPAEAGEFEDFFEQGATLGADEAGPARARTQPEPEIFDSPLITEEQLARRARLRRMVAVLVSALGVASALLFASRGLRPRADAEPVPASVKPVATALGAARPQWVEPVFTPALSQEPEVREAAASQATPVAATPVAAMLASPAPRAAPLPRRTSAAQATVLPPANESSRQLPASPRTPPRATSAPARAAAAARPSRAAEPPPTASFPIDPQ